MVAGENDNGVVVKTTVLEGLHELANVVVDIADRTVVSSLGPLDLLWSEIVVLEVHNVLETLAVGILLVLGNFDIRHVDVDILVHVPVLVLDGVRVVRVRERDGQAERTLVCRSAHVVVQVLLCLVHDFLVIVELVATDTRPCLVDGRTVVVPLQLGVGVVPVHRPAQIAGVDVCRQSSLVPVELLADEVHLATEDALVAFLSQVVGVCGCVLGDGRSIVVSTNLGRELACDHGHAAGSTER